MRYFLSIIFIVTNLYTSTLNNTLLEIHATLIPKILLLQNNIKQNINDQTINITIVYDQNNYKDMKFLKQAIKTKFPDGVSGYKIDIKTTEYESFKKCYNNTHLVYMLPSSRENIEMIVKAHKAYKVVTFAYDKKYLSSDVMFSVHLDREVKPIINLKAVKSSGISFRPILLSISKVYENDK